MAERPTRSPELPVRTLGGLNQRPSKANLRPGEFDVLEGLYPGSVGLQSRIPGKTLFTQLSQPILQIAGTLNTNGDVLIQSGSNLYAYTLDEIQGRVVTPNLVPNPTGEEETMSQAIIVQREASGVPGGSISGIITGTDASSSPNTFYARRLTNILVNESSTVTTFTPTVGGTGGTAPSVAGSFVLSPGDYRITIYLTFCANSATWMFGLYNVTTAAFEVYSGTSDAVISTVSLTGGGPNQSAYLKGKITVSSTNKTYSIYQQASLAGAGPPQTGGRNLTACGDKLTCTGTVLGAAPLNTYTSIEILKVS